MMTRRTFSKTVAFTALSTNLVTHAQTQNSPQVRLGGPIYGDEYDCPETWIKAIQAKGYRAANCPINEKADDQTVKDYKEAAQHADITIAEVGAWSNPICPEDDIRKAAIKKCINKLALADRIEARCCVNVTGSISTEGIAGPHKDNLTPDTFDLIVETTRKIIDAVKPKRSYYTLETMPWAYPDSIQSYLDLIKAIDRKALAVHFDPVNLVNSPSRYYNNGAMIKEAFKKLGPLMRSCHAKDSLLSTKLTTHLDEVVPGTGNLDYAVYLKELSKLDNVPLMMEHIKRQEYPQAAEYIRKVGKQNGIQV